MALRKLGAERAHAGGRGGVAGDRPRRRGPKNQASGTHDAGRNRPGVQDRRRRAGGSDAAAARAVRQPQTRWERIHEDDDAQGRQSELVRIGGGLARGLHQPGQRHVPRQRRLGSAHRRRRARRRRGEALEQDAHVGADRGQAGASARRRPAAHLHQARRSVGAQPRRSRRRCSRIPTPQTTIAPPPTRSSRRRNPFEPPIALDDSTTASRRRSIRRRRARAVAPSAPRWSSPLPRGVPWTANPMVWIARRVRRLRRAARCWCSSMVRTMMPSQPVVVQAPAAGDRAAAAGSRAGGAGGDAARQRRRRSRAPPQPVVTPLEARRARRRRTRFRRRPSRSTPRRRVTRPAHHGRGAGSAGTRPRRRAGGQAGEARRGRRRASDDDDDDDWRRPRPRRRRRRPRSGGQGRKAQGRRLGRSVRAVTTRTHA